MKAVIVSKYGPPEGLTIKDMKIPSPKSNEVLIRNHATTVTFGDAMLRRMGRASRLVLGLFMGGLGEGKILGHEFAGVVESVGDEVTLFKPRDEVFGSAGMKGGAYAEYLTLSEDAMFTIKPNNVSFEESAAIPIGAHTAYDILRKGKVEEGQRVLIYGGSGSVGTYAIQLAKFWGAEVTGVSSKRNHELLMSLGTNHVIDYKSENFLDRDEKYDVIFDTVRKLSSKEVKNSLKPNGIFLSTRESTDENRANIIFLRELVEEGKLAPIIDKIFPLEQIVEAHRYVDTGRKKGNIVITIASE
jgi:NADPH:quinone reductase-like Zn-dependent oxidoreductase